MTAVIIIIIFWLTGSVASVALMIVHMRRTVDERKAGRHRRDSEVHRGRAQAVADIEEHDIDDMLDAIGEYRRRAGRRTSVRNSRTSCSEALGTIDAD